MRVAIHSLQKTLFKGEAEKLIAQTPMGEITILENHLPLISSLKGPAIKILDKDKKEDLIEIGSGFLEVRPESEVVVLIDQ